MHKRSIQINFSRRGTTARFIFLSILLTSYSLHGAAKTPSKNFEQTSLKQVNSKNNSKGQLQNTAPGEYVVTVKGNNDANVVKHVFSKYSVVSVTGLDNTPGVFLLKLNEDPGLDTLQNTADKSGKIKAIQPNFIYRINTPQRGGPQ
ncbi:MAG: hypothetical protein OEV78_06015 [Spirochaetia bacterium]|nr:hypothetical protein [Spirochaetia bacterium]